MNISCPGCQQRENVTKLRQPFQFGIGTLFWAMLGGMIGGLFWALGQEGRYRCDKCERIFYAHTRLSRTFFFLAIAVYVGIGIIVLSLIFTPKK